MTARVREMEQGSDEDFSEWFSDLTLREEEETGRAVHLEDRYLILTNDIGDWIGGLRFYFRGGVAHLLDIAVTPEERHNGHGHRLVGAFEEVAREAGAHRLEFWTDDLTNEGELIAMGWQRILRRDDYIGHQTWYLMDKALGD